MGTGFEDQDAERVTTQLRDKRRDLLARPDAVVRAQEPTIRAINHEITKITTTRSRLATLRFQHINEKDVYGQLCAQPEQLTENLSRWQARPENQAIEQLAMAPKNDDDELMVSVYGRTIGAPYTLDIDSII